MAVDVLAIGVSTIDLLVQVPQFPEPDGRMHMRDFTQAIGGNATVAAVALARLGASVALASTVGDDTYGRAVRDGLQEDGVDVALLTTDPQAPTPTTVIISDATAGTRSIINHPVTARARIWPSDAITRAAVEARYVHLDHAAFPHLADELLPRLRSRETLVSFDAGVEVPGIETYLPLIDVYATTERQLVALTGERELGRALSMVRAAGPRVAVTTMGREGSAALAEDGSLVVVPAFPVEVADTTGAGDVFHGALLYALLQDYSIRDALIFANAAAALSCRALGGRPGCPTRPQVDALLRIGR